MILAVKIDSINGAIFLLGISHARVKEMISIYANPVFPTLEPGNSYAMSTYRRTRKISHSIQHTSEILAVGVAGHDTPLKNSISHVGESKVQKVQLRLSRHGSKALVLVR
jgi:hypothetical protein